MAIPTLAPYEGPTNASGRIQNRIRERHPFSATPKDIGDGYYVGGYGYVISPSEMTETIAQETAEQWLKIKLEKAQANIDAKITKTLDQPKKDALISLIYDTGSAWMEAGIPGMINEGASAKQIKDTIKGIKPPAYYDSTAMTKARRHESALWTRSRDRLITGGVVVALLIVLVVVITRGRKKKK